MRRRRGGWEGVTVASRREVTTTLGLTASAGIFEVNRNIVGRTPAIFGRYFPNEGTTVVTSMGA